MPPIARPNRRVRPGRAMAEGSMPRGHCYNRVAPGRRRAAMIAVAALVTGLGLAGAASGQAAGQSTNQAGAYSSAAPAAQTGAPSQGDTAGQNNLSKFLQGLAQAAKEQAAKEQA